MRLKNLEEKYKYNPTLVDIPKTRSKYKYKKFTVMWIGSQSTSKYLII